MWYECNDCPFQTNSPKQQRAHVAEHPSHTGTTESRKTSG